MTKSFIMEHYQPFSNISYGNTVIEPFENKKKNNMGCKKIKNMYFPPNKQCDLSGRIPICQNTVSNWHGGKTLTISDALNNRYLENPYANN